MKIWISNKFFRVFCLFTFEIPTPVQSFRLTEISLPFSGSRSKLQVQMSLHSFVVQLLSCARLFETPQTAACQASVSFMISQSLLKLMSIELVMSSNHLILCHLLLPSVFPSIRVFFQWVDCSHQVAKVLELQRWFSLGWTGLISLPSKGLSNLLQHHS